MAKHFTKDELHKKWSTGDKLFYNGVSYRVGKMSYGDYFFEPGPEGRETDPFNKGTLWLERINKFNYAVIG